MEWIYDSPFNEREYKAYVALKKGLKKDQIAKRTIKLLSLMAFLRKHKFRNAEEIQRSAYYDNEKRKPIFDHKTAKEILHKLKKKGGKVDASKFPFADYIAKSTLSYITPDFLETPIQNVHETLLKNPVENIKNWFPVFHIVADALHLGTSSAIDGMTSIGEGVGGPIGATVVAPFVALATIPSTVLASAEGDFGQIVSNGLSIVPVVGPAMSNALYKFESGMDTAVDSNSSIPTYLPIVGPYVEQERAKLVAGKRFLTQRRRYKQWKKTRRNKSAKV